MPPVDRVALTVVYFLGAAVLVGLTGVVFLVWHATSYEEINPSTVALVAGVSTLVGGALGALGSILASTGKGAPQPVTVENAPADPVPTAPVGPAASSAFAVGDPSAPLKES